jgi:hypothetical protein
MCRLGLLVMSSPSALRITILSGLMSRYWYKELGTYSFVLIGLMISVLLLLGLKCDFNVTFLDDGIFIYVSFIIFILLVH